MPIPPYTAFNTSLWAIPEGYEVLSINHINNRASLYIKSLAPIVQYDYNSKKKNKLRRIDVLQGNAYNFEIKDDLCLFEIKVRTGRIYLFKIPVDKMLKNFIVDIFKTRKNIIDTMLLDIS